MEDGLDDEDRKVHQYVEANAEAIFKDSLWGDPLVSLVWIYIICDPHQGGRSRPGKKRSTFAWL